MHLEVKSKSAPPAITGEKGDSMGIVLEVYVYREDFPPAIEFRLRLGPRVNTEEIVRGEAPNETNLVGIILGHVNQHPEVEVVVFCGDVPGFVDDGPFVVNYGRPRAIAFLKKLLPAAEERQATTATETP